MIEPPHEQSEMRELGGHIQRGRIATLILIGKNLSKSRKVFEE